MKVSSLACFLALLPVTVLADGGTWRSLANRPDCQVWSGNPISNESADWSGACKNGKADGSGELTWRFSKSGTETTERFVGNMVDGRASGAGVYFFASGAKYDGTWRNDVPDGSGKIILADLSWADVIYRDGTIIQVNDCFSAKNGKNGGCKVINSKLIWP